MKKNRKGITIFGLLVLCVALTAGLFKLGQIPKALDNDMNPSDTLPVATQAYISAPEITVPPITAEKKQDDTPSSDVESSEIPSQAPPTSEQSDTDVPLTKIEVDKPEPPPPPVTASQSSAPTDPALTNPNCVPDVKVDPVDPEEPKTPAPQSGDKKDGQIYIPGFGWIKDEGGGTKVTQSVGKGSMDKMVGY